MAEACDCRIGWVSGVRPADDPEPLWYIVYCPTHAAAFRLWGALAALADEQRHDAMCGCDHEQDDPACAIGAARALLKETIGRG